MASGKRDYYEVIGVSRDCSLDELKKVYRRLARKYHPDVNNGDRSAEEKFKEISEAYAVLSNEEKRRQYDQFGFSRNLFKDVDFSSVFSEFDFGDIFNAFFGDSSGGGFSTSQRSRRQRRGSDIDIDIECSFKEAAFGVKKEVEYLVNDTCEACGGRGSTDEDGIVTCSVCGGTGQVRNTRQTFIGSVITTSTCKNCQGTGKVIKNPCKKCGGNGYYRKNKKVKVDIPAGIHDMDRLRVRGKGSYGGIDSINGDLFITIRVKPHPAFKRDGDDVISSVDISFAQAALGCRLQLETLDGTEEVIIKPGTQPVTKIVLKSRGMVHLNGYRRGDHIVSVNVKIPTKLTQEEEDLLRKFAEGRGEIIGDENHSFFSNLKDAFKK